MKAFLKQIAERYYTAYHGDLRKCAFVFPNKRAGLFFRLALGKVANKPLFSPDIFAINDLFFNASPLQPADHVTAQFMLYDTYCKVMHRNESFDQFYAFGEMLLTDFNDVDKYMADARQIFHNVSDLKDIELDYSWLSDEQRAIVRRFWEMLNGSVHKNFERQFSDVWKGIYDLYVAFKEALRQRGIGYDGMIFRDVAEQTDSLQLGDYERVVFIGFNALTTTERALMLHCQKRGIGDYYFDYQSPEVCDSGNIAAQFINENRLFKPCFELDAPEEPLQRQIELIAVPSTIGQTKQVYNILKTLPENNLQTVVVLPNEQLLIPQLHAIPATFTDKNVTMGYPMTLTPLAALMEHIATLQKNSRAIGGTTHFYHKHVLAVLNHPYIFDHEQAFVTALVERIHKENLFLVAETAFAENALLAKIFRHVESVPEYVAYFAQLVDVLAQTCAQDDLLEHEFFDCYKAAINRLSDNIATYPVTLSTEMFFRLLRQITRSITVPFAGTPVKGLQLMGTLETRALDFDNVIITAFNEDSFPRKHNTPSIIPYNLRRAFGLPTHEYHDAIFAYNFYRLIYRAKQVFLIYDSRTNSTKPTELSRYAKQLEYLYLPRYKSDRPLLIKKSVGYEVPVENAETGFIEKTEDVMQRLARFYHDDAQKQHISASDINAYLDCPVRFYYSKVAKLGEPDEVSETIEANTFGSIYHRVMELIYTPYKNLPVTQETIDNLIGNKSLIDNYIRQAFTEIFFKNRNDMPLVGQNLLIAHIIKTYVEKTLQFDKNARAPFTYSQSEERIALRLQLANGLVINLKGIIDRIDKKNGLTHIVDYKTGKVTNAFTTIEQLFDTNEKTRPKAVMQTFFYALIYKLASNVTEPIKPIIYALQKLDNYEIIQNNGRTRKEVVNDFADYEDEFRRALEACLSEIFDANIPFKRTDDKHRCEYCNFKKLCNC